MQHEAPPLESCELLFGAALALGVNASGRFECDRMCWLVHITDRQSLFNRRAISD